MDGGLLAFRARVAEVVDAAVEGLDCDPDQHALMRAVLREYRSATRDSVLGDPVSLFYLIASAEGGDPLSTGAEHLAVFAVLYLLALDLFDDVQDDDLAGKSHGDAGPAIALNNALVLLFLSLSAVARGARALGDGNASLLAAVASVGVLTCRGQHRDLVSASRRPSAAEVLAAHREKTASLTLICELAARSAPTSPDRLARYLEIGRSLSVLAQIIDDLRDIFGQDNSLDLAAGKVTYPIACFMEIASDEQRAKLHQLNSERPLPMREIRALLYSSGAVERVARTLELERSNVHHEVAALGGASPHHRTLLLTIDGLVSDIYVPRGLSVTSHLQRPTGPWHATVRRCAQAIAEQLRGVGLAPPPDFVSWPLPQWTYESRRRVIYYPDVEGYPEDTLRMPGTLLGLSRLADVADVMLGQIPFVLAHEVFHFQRHVCGRLTDDMWLEELAASALAVAYCRAFAPEALRQGVLVAQRVLARPENVLSERAQDILEGLSQSRTPGGGYHLRLPQVALVQLGMTIHLERAAEDLSTAVGRWLAS